MAARWFRASLRSVDRFLGRTEAARGMAADLHAYEHRSLRVQAHQVDLVAADHQVTRQDLPAKCLQEPPRDTSASRPARPRLVRGSGAGLMHRR